MSPGWTRRGEGDVILSRRWVIAAGGLAALVVLGLVVYIARDVGTGTEIPDLGQAEAREQDPPALADDPFVPTTPALVGNPRTDENATSEEPEDTPTDEAPASATDTADLDLSLRTAVADLDRLRLLLRQSRSLNVELTAEIDAVSFAYRELREAVSGNAAWAKEHEGTLNRFFEGAEEAFLKAYRLEKRDRPGDPNSRTEVNLVAVRALAATGRADLSKDIREVFETTHLAGGAPLEPFFVEALLVALARLGEVASLEWMIARFIHVTFHRPSEVDTLRRAHRAMRGFEARRVPGPVRHELVRRMIVIYADVESVALAGQSAPTVDFWKRVGPEALATARHFALDPRDEDGRELETLEALHGWFREHENVRRPPWTDETASGR